MSKSIKKIQNHDDKKSTKKWHIVYRTFQGDLNWKNKSWRKTVNSIDCINYPMQIFKNQRLEEYQHSLVTIKHLKVELFIGQGTGFTSAGFWNSLINSITTQNPFPTYSKYEAHELICQRMMNAKAYLIYHPASLDILSSFTYKENARHMVVESEDNIFMQHPEWVLDQKTFKLNIEGSTTVVLESPLARNIRPHGQIWVILSFTLLDVSWKVWYPTHRVTYNVSYSLGV